MRRAPGALVAAGAVVLLAAVVAAVVSLAASDPEPAPRASATPQPLERPAGIQGASAPALGIAFDYPLDWRRSDKRGVVRLSSADRRVALAITTPSGPSGAALERVRRDSERELLRGYRGAKLLGRRDAQVGRAGLKARATAIAATTTGGPLDILLLTTASEWRGYAVTVFTARDAVRREIEAAGVVLDSLVFTDPR